MTNRELKIKFKNGDERTFNLVWFYVGFDNEKNEYILTGYKNQNAYGFGDSGIINNLKFNADDVESIGIT